jgi:hypothetical protein
VASAVALAVGARCRGGDLLSGVELAQVALDRGCAEVSVRALEGISGFPSLARLGEAPGGLINIIHASVGTCGCPAKPRGEDRHPGVIGRWAELELPELE